VAVCASCGAENREGLSFADAKGNLIEAARHREALDALGSGDGPALEGYG
jgi:hypothetical protein